MTPLGIGGTASCAEIAGAIVRRAAGQGLDAQVDQPRAFQIEEQRAEVRQRQAVIDFGIDAASGQRAEVHVGVNDEALLGSEQ